MIDRDGYNHKARKGNREIKSSLFTKLFEDNKSKIELYNALTGEELSMDAEVLEVTLDDVLYHDMRNDLGFIIDSRFLVLSEHQSTINENMPMRELQYVARTYELIAASKTLYKEKLFKVPTPEFFVIYTGERPWDKEYLKLSDSFMTEPVDNSMELVVKVIDIRYNKDESNPILEKSEKLKGYSILLSYLKEAKERGYDRTKSIDVAIDRCIKEGVLGDFLRRNSSEMGSFLYDSISVEEFIELRAEERAEDLVEEKLAKKTRILEERAEQLAEERAEQLAEEHTRTLAKKMKERGYDVLEIAELTKLTKEQIENL